MKYAFIQEHRQQWPIRVQCRVLGVSVAGYHEHRARRQNPKPRRHLGDETLLVHIRAIYNESRGAYGWPRIWRQLQRQEIRVGKQRVQQLMQQHGIRARGQRRFRIRTTDSRHSLPVADNVLNRQFTTVAPNQVWVGDMTYIATGEGWLFLAVVLDLLSRQVVGWALHEDMGSELIINAFQMAWLQRRPGRKAGLLFHSDRGSQYASHSFQQVLRQHGVQSSMSRKGNCWDTQFSIPIERWSGLTRAGIGQAAFALTCRSCAGVL